MARRYGDKLKGAGKGANIKRVGYTVKTLTAMDEYKRIENMVTYEEVRREIYETGLQLNEDLHKVMKIAAKAYINGDQKQLGLCKKLFNVITRRIKRCDILLNKIKGGEEKVTFRRDLERLRKEYRI